MSRSAEIGPRHRILHVIDTLNRGGAERMAIEIANASAADGHEVAVCVTRSQAPWAMDLSPAVRLEVVGRRWRLDPKGFSGVRSLERSFSPSVVHCHGLSSFSLLALLRFMGWLETPVVLHDHLGKPANAKIPIWFRYLGRRVAAHYIAVSEAQREWAVGAGLTRSRTTVICNRMALDRILDAEARLPENLVSRDPGLITGLMVGGLRQEKGLEVLVEACMYLEVSAEWRLLVVGPATEPSYFERCRRLVQSAGLDGKVLFVGPRDDVPAIARSCDFGVVPSLSESGPLALAEFLAAGIPVVATRVGQISKLTERAGIAGFVEPGDPRALATQLSEVIDLSAAERKRRGELGQRVAREMLDIRESMPDLYKVYSAVGGEDCAC